MKDNKGFSIIELSIAIALLGIVLLAFMDVMQYMRIMENRVKIRADSHTSQTLGERFLWMGLKNAAPSFNNIPMLDDNGFNFYDLNRDVPSNSIPNATRILTLNLIGGQTTFFALLSESTTANVSSGAPEVMFLDPAKFYQINDLAAPAATPFNWTFFRNYILAQNPNFLAKATQVLEIYVPSTFRNIGAPVSTMPNSTSYFLRCTSSPTPCNTENFGGMVSFKNAADNTVSIANFDDFVKTIPPASGGIPPILARVVRMVRYQLQPKPSYATGIGDLSYSTWDGAGFTAPVLIADRVKQVVLQRPNITDPTITIDLTLEKR